MDWMCSLLSRKCWDDFWNRLKRHYKRTPNGTSGRNPDSQWGRWHDEFSSLSWVVAMGQKPRGSDFINLLNSSSQSGIYVPLPAKCQPWISLPQRFLESGYSRVSKKGSFSGVSWGWQRTASTSSILEHLSFKNNSNFFHWSNTCTELK